jgi:prepilin-type N-terminal cleavage/methylation domain-containing protein
MHCLHRPNPSARSGFTLVELAVGIAILTIGTLAMLSTVVASQKLETSNRERLLARMGAQSVVRDVQITARAVAAEQGLEDWGTNFIAELSAPNNWVPVDGLQPWSNLQNVCEVVIVNDETASDDDLGFELGMPRDLNGDGVVDDTAVTSEGKLFPVIVRVRWETPAGQRELVHGFYVTPL